MENVTQHDTNKKETLEEKEDEGKSSIGQFPNLPSFFDLRGHFKDCGCRFQICSINRTPTFVN